MPLDPYKRAHWADHHRQWQASGLSQRDYCQRESLSLSSFDRWRRLIRDADKKAVPTRAEASKPEKLTLVPAQIDAPSRAGTQIVLQSPSGWQVTIPAMLDTDTFISLLSRLP